jgi:DNA-directed RNA polymerase subunit RPC12/RpoP
MALVKCSECGREISTRANACPGCGAKRPWGWKWAKRAAIIIVVLVIADGVVTLTMLSRDEAKIRDCWNQLNSAESETTQAAARIACPLLEREFEINWGSKPKR